MARKSSIGAPEGIDSGTGRTPRQRGAAPGKEWVQPYRRAQRKLDDAASLIIASVWTVADAGCDYHQPGRSRRKLGRALHEAAVASVKHAEAEQYLLEAVAAVEHAPPELLDDDAAELVEMATERFQTVSQYISVAVNQVVLGHEQILQGIESGEIAPEDLVLDDRPRRRVIRHNPLFVRAFLSARRQPRVGDRITPILRRRRRTLLPAEVRVPRRHLLGRAPPLSSTCSL